MQRAHVMQLPKLKPGSRVAVVSPASAAVPARVAAGVEALRRFGYQPVVMPHALCRGPLYYAGTAEQRAADLMAAFADPEIEALLCTRGGWGSAELLPLLDADLVRSHPKVFVGYSDHSSLHTWLWNRCRLPSVYGPMVAADWARDGGVDLPTWRGAVEGGQGSLQEGEGSLQEGGQGPWRVGPADGLRVLRAGETEGQTQGRTQTQNQGRLLGGCLAILEASLGTPWAFCSSEPTVLFLEDIGVKPYQWDRMLQHLRFAGVMEHVRAVVFGDMGACGEPSEADLFEAACLHGLREFRGPVLSGLRCGHVQGRNRSLPLGAWVEVKADTVAEIAPEAHGETPGEIGPLL